MPTHPKVDTEQAVSMLSLHRNVPWICQKDVCCHKTVSQNHHRN